MPTFDFSHWNKIWKIELFTVGRHTVQLSQIVVAAYGSPTDKIQELILQACQTNDLIEQSPIKPVVIFDEFGDNALNFEVFFWTHARQEMILRQRRSELRFAIDALFREHQLVIAYPQRDIHLDTIKPLDVRILKD